jgi:hypothetical protein
MRKNTVLPSFTRWDATYTSNDLECKSHLKNGKWHIFQKMQSWHCRSSPLPPIHNVIISINEGYMYEECGMWVLARLTYLCMAWVHVLYVYVRAVSCRHFSVLESAPSYYTNVRAPIGVTTGNHMYEVDINSNWCCVQHTRVYNILSLLSP